MILIIINPIIINTTLCSFILKNVRNIPIGTVKVIIFFNVYFLRKQTNYQ